MNSARRCLEAFCQFLPFLSFPFAAGIGGQVLQKNEFVHKKMEVAVVEANQRLKRFIVSLHEANVNHALSAIK
jgi:hypothetical protein